MLRVAIVGSTGMLGHAMASEFSADDRFEVKTYCRSPKGEDQWVDAHKPSSLNFLDDVDYVINCVGLIKQLTLPHRRDWFVVNSVFPWLLQERCLHVNARLIHVSTDCVFSGLGGGYSEHDPFDATDDYGISKSCGEPDRSMVLRTSIIGPELSTKLSLLEWAISRRGSKVDGYTNHLWNGLTSLQYADACKQIISRNLWRPGVHHLHSDVVTKHQLLHTISEAFDLKLDIVPKETPTKCDRSLVTVKPLNGLLEIPSVAEMVSTLART